MLVWWPQLAPLPYHLGPWNGEQESVGHRQAVHRCGLVLGVVPAGRIAVGRHHSPCAPHHDFRHT